VRAPAREPRGGNRRPTVRPSRTQRGDQRLSGAVLTVIDERAHRREPEAALVGGRGRLLSECAVTRVASMSMITCPPRRRPGVPASGRDRAHTAARAVARAARIAGSETSMSAASAATTRETVGSLATGPNTAGWARTAATSARQSPPERSGRDVEEHLPGVVDRPSRPPRRKRRGQLTPQTGMPRRCHHQQGSRGGDQRQRLASTIKTQRRSIDILPLRSVFHSDHLTTSQSQVFRAGQALPCFHRPVSPAASRNPEARTATTTVE